MTPDNAAASQVLKGVDGHRESVGERRGSLDDPRTGPRADNAGPALASRTSIINQPDCKAGIQLSGTSCTDEVVWNLIMCAAICSEGSHCCTLFEFT
jgi:hypothetical protein